VNLIYAILLVESIRATLEHRRLRSALRYDRTLDAPLSPPISILVPARNEQAGIVESVTSLLALDYPEIEVIVINDGSTDNTLGELRERFQLLTTDIVYVPEIPTSAVKTIYISATDRRLVVLDKISCGRKADALNAGLNAASSPFVCAIDGDAILEDDSLRRIMMPALNDPARVIASGGIVRAANGSVVEGGRVKQVRMPRGVLEGLQVLEYLRSFLIGRQGWARLDMLLIISGAFGVFQRDACRTIGGFRASAIGEDMDLIVRLHRHARESGGRYKVAFVPDPVCWTEVPASLRTLSSQRARWQNGLADVLWKNRDMTLNPAYGRIGMFAMPYQWIFECFAPLIEVAGWLGVLAAAIGGALSGAHLLTLMLGGYLMSALVSVGAVLIEEMVYRRYNEWSDLLRLIGYCFLEPLFYRPFNTVWRIKGLWHFLRKKNSWQLLPRSGFAKAKAA
jgi:cellulose synthase/poly-beta-1,6-N-acetylglucosamine synthase-like glycosyltransferase